MRRPGRALGAQALLIGVLITVNVTADGGNSGKGGTSPVDAPHRTYRNPIIDCPGAADPAVIRYKEKYYLYPTTDCKGYDVFVSDDLVHWEKKPKCFADARGQYWAPDVFHNASGDGRFYLYYTLNRPGTGPGIGVASAGSPLGPFEDRGMLVDGGVLDAHLFRDDNGLLYLYYASQPGGSRIVVQPMADTLTKTGQVTNLIQPTEDWEKHGWQTVEGPWMLKHKGLYYLMYSGSDTLDPNYAVGYATATNPIGPFTKYEGNPIARRGNGVIAPGHHCVVAGPAGRLWMVYHQKKTETKEFDRFLAIDPLWFDEKGAIHVKLSRETDEPAP